MAEINSSKHPEYIDMLPDWEKYRLVAKGGTDFLDKYLLRRPKEKPEDFSLRKQISYIPAHAKASLNNVKNSIFSRINQQTRRFGPKTYMAAVSGLNGGVDRRHNTMTSFLDDFILPDLLAIGRVGVFVTTSTIRTEDDSPYIYSVPAENILNWVIDPENPGEYLKLLLKAKQPKLDDFGLPVSTEDTYQFLEKTGPNTISMKTYTADGKSTLSFTFTLSRIPFTLLQLSQSLLTDVASYQISLLNLASSDMAYAYLSNIPIYVEQQDPNDGFNWNKGAGGIQGDPGATGADEMLVAHVGERAENDMRREVIGATTGRTYGRNMDAPSFINPSPAPLRVSMEKSQEMKDDIRLLINLALSNIKPRAASAESKTLDERGLESGLSSIGLELQSAENAILSIWQEYENEIQDDHIVVYPSNYTLNTDADRRATAASILDIKDRIPSPTAKLALTIEAVNELLISKVSQLELDKIITEIKGNRAQPSAIKDIILAVEQGLVSSATASLLLGYDPDEVTIAQEEKAKRIADTQAAQRGSEDFVANDPKPGRGEAKVPNPETI